MGGFLFFVCFFLIGLNGELWLPVCPWFPATLAFPSTQWRLLRAVRSSCPRCVILLPLVTSISFLLSAHGPTSPPSMELENRDSGTQQRFLKDAAESPTGNTENSDLWPGFRQEKLLSPQYPRELSQAESAPAPLSRSISWLWGRTPENIALKRTVGHYKKRVF